MPDICVCVFVRQWQDDIVPLGRNMEGDLLVVHANGTYSMLTYIKLPRMIFLWITSIHRTCVPAGVSTWSSDEGLGSVESASLGQYLESYRNKMLAGKLEYVEDCGIMEVE